MAWIQYSKFIKVTGGAILFALALAPIGIYVSIQNLADSRSAYEERSRIYSLTGTESPSAVSDYIGPHLIWSTLYDDTMVAARVLVTNQSDKHIWWLCGSITNGMGIVGADSVWYLGSQSTSLYGIVTYTYVQTPESNVSETVSVSASIVTNSDCVYTPNAAFNQHVLALEIYDYYREEGDISSSDSLFGGDDSFWTWCGNGTNVYKYGCETWEQELTVALIYGSGFSAVPGTLPVVQYDRYEDITVTSTDDDEYATPLLGGVFRVSGGGLDPAYFVVTDNGTPSYVTVNKTHISLTEGGAAGTFTLKPNFGSSSSSTTINITKLGAGFDVSPSSHTWPAHVETTNITVTVTPTSSASYSDQCGLVAMQRIPPYGSWVYDYIAVRVTDTNGTDNGISVSDSFLSLTKGASDTTSATVGTNGLLSLTTSKYVASNNLVEVNRVLTNLQATICFDDAYFTSTTRIWNTVTGYTNGTHDVDEGESSYTIGDAVGVINAISASSPVVTSHTASFGEGSGLFTINAYYEILQRDDLGDNNDESTIYADLTMRTYDYPDIQLEYPSLWALSNGYVQAVHVYASCISDGFSRLNNRNITDLTSYTADTSDPNKYENADYLFGVIDEVRHSPTNLAWVTENVYTQCSFTKGSWIDCPVIELFSTNINAAIVNDLITFDLSFSSITNLNLLAGDYQTINTQYTSSGDDYDSDEGKFVQNVKVDKLFIVVVWAWKHFSPYTDFIATNYVPSWVTSNTNSP